MTAMNISLSITPTRLQNNMLPRERKNCQDVSKVKAEMRFLRTWKAIKTRIASYFKLQ